VAEEDYYAILGVSRNATEDEIKRAYRTLARELHPDRHAGGASAANNEERFKLVNRAYESLKDPERRRQYDMFGPAGERAADPFAGFAGGGLGDIFDAFFGGAAGPFAGRTQGRQAGPPPGENVEALLDLEFHEAVLGAEKEVTVRAAMTCETCAGSGAHPGTSPCTDCRGQGRRMEDRAYTVDVPAGVDDGSTLRLSNRGSSGPRGGPPGDLYLHLRVRPHPLLSRDGVDLRTDMHVTMAQAALGAQLTVETLDGPQEITVPPGTPTGQELRFRGQGVPHLQRRGRGDLLVTVSVETPTELTAAQEDLLRRFAAARGEEVAPPDAGLLSRIRGAFK
jgi:molecular chaperone DnaJ